MDRVISTVALAALVCGGAMGQQISNAAVSVSAEGESGAYTGFVISADGGDVATISFGSNGAITARRVTAKGAALRFEGLSCEPTPTLGPGSHVEVRLVGDSPYPQVRFEFELQDFDRDAWEGRFGEVPFHFLTCSQPGAKVFHQRGWAIGTPVIDDYIQRQAEGFGRQVVSAWSRDWMYAPPIGAYPMANAGLWEPTARTYVGYDFHGARLTDHSEKNFGTSYCWECQDSREFFCLTWPYGDHYINLRYPEELPVTCGTHFRVLWSREIGKADDPNDFVNGFIWSEYADLLPDVEPMNDLSWLPDNYRISDFPVPGGLGPFYTSSGEEPRWWAPEVHFAEGVGYFSPVDYYFDAGDEQNIRRLADGCREIVKLGEWFEVDGERCFAWQTPLDGGGAEFFGPGVETKRHVKNWFSALALLDYYRNDPEGAADLLPVIDGCLNWTRHTLYTRNCYPDVPAAQFAWSATPAVTFCLKYYYEFRDKPGHEERAALAYKLARSMAYRYLAIWPCDNDEMDDLDSSFMMEPNAGLNWLGCACANEIWVYNIAMLYEYVATGDAVMGHYLRGMLERYHEMFQDQWYPSVRAYGAEFTERLGLFDECAQGKGVRGSFGGLWGNFERLIWPLGEAKARVVCGEKAAMCFNRDGRHTDIAQYTCGGGAEFSFKLVPGGLQADADAEFAVTVSFPFFDIAGKAVSIYRDGEHTRVPAESIVTYRAEASTVTLKGVKLGDTISVGDVDPNLDVLECGIAKKRTMPDADGESFLERGGFKMLNLARGAFEGIDRNWDDVGSMAGYESGTKTIYGVPFLLLDPDLTGNNVCVPRRGIAYGEKPEYLFVLLGDVEERSRLTLYREGGEKERVDLAGAVPVIKGWPPVLEWHLDLVMVENRGQVIQSIAPTGCKVFAVTSVDEQTAAMPEIVAAIGEQREKMRVHEELVASVRALAPLFEPFSGHIAVLPNPKQTNPRSSEMVRILHQAGLVRHVKILTPEELVNPRVFSTTDIWIAFYVGGEPFYQSVNREGDAEEAMVDWLKGGGTLVSLCAGPFPFYYNEEEKPVVNAPKFGLPISGSGYEGRLDTLDVADVRGWERVPEGLELTFHVDAEQEVFTSLPKTIPWPEEGDPRWRPIFNVVDEGNVYTPLVTLKDQDGTNYGEAAAMIEYKAGELAGARVVYVWHTLRLATGLGRDIVTDLLRYLLTNTMRPIGEYTAYRAAQAPVIDGKLDDEIWQQAPATEAFVRFDPSRADGAYIKTTAKMAWDDGNLYVAWECDDPDIWSAITERDGNLWEGEVVEVFVDPDGDGKNYQEFEISPLNTVIDLSVAEVVKAQPADVEAARKWNATDWQTAVQVRGTLDDREDTDEGWTAETAIPLRNFTTAENLPPHMGDAWRVQLLRIDRSNKAPNMQFSAWSDTNTFHNPERFGRVVFAGNPFRESFEGYDAGAAPTPTWAVSSGQWRVTGGELVGKNSGTSGFLPTGIVTGDEGWKDYRVTLRFQAREVGGDHRDGVWVGLRYASPAQCYSVNLQRDGMVVCKANAGRTSGDFNYLAETPLKLDDRWHEMAVEIRGARIVVDLDGERVINVVDDGYLGVPSLEAGGICLSARRWENSPGDTVVAFDDVRVDMAE